MCRFRRFTRQQVAALVSIVEEQMRVHKGLLKFKLQQLTTC